MNFSSKQTIESTTHPGVRFIVRTLGVAERAQRDLDLLDVDVRLQAIRDKIATVSDEIVVAEGDDAGKTTVKAKPGKESEWARLNAEFGLVLTSQKYPALIRAALIGVEGLEVDGKPATPEDMVRCPDTSLFHEAVAACLAASGLSAVQEKNSPPPGTSPAPEAGPASPTIAAVAGA